MKLRKPDSKFYRWWNSYSGRRIISAAYSLGASIVILGAMFKILHYPIGNIMLGIGMSVESVIFALGIFDRPYREYDWSKIFNFKAEDDERLDVKTIATAVQGGVQTAFIQPSLSGEVVPADFQQIYGPAGVQQTGVQEAGIQQTGGTNGILFGETLSEDDVQKLSEGIKNLTLTAENLQTLANVALAANGFARNIETASEMAASFADTQQKLNTNAETLAASYQGVNTEMDNVVSNTRNYSVNVDNVNRSLSTINSIYEIQLRHIQSQTESLNQQAEAIRQATTHIDGVASDMDKMKEAAAAAQAESQRYQSATRKLTRQVEDLNTIYGNMLNALS
ncbi:MAG: gliding motility protein GldL [Paludibacteraceae bacterium]